MKRQFTHFLIRPIDPASLVMFRVVFGFLLITDIMNTYLSGVISDLAASPVQFTYYGFGWVPMPSDTMLLFVTMAGCAGAAMFAAGRWYYMGVTLMTAVYAWFFLVEKSLYLNHGYLTIVLCLLCFIIPLHRQGRFFDGHEQPGVLYGWHLFLLCFSMGVVYFFGGIAKLNSDWLQALPLQIWLPNVKQPLFFGPFIEELWFAYFISYGGVIFDLSIVFFMLSKRFRLYAFAAAVLFHLSNHIFFNIGTFPWLSLMLTSLFFSPSFPRKLPWLGRWFERHYEVSEEYFSRRMSTSTINRLVLPGLAIYAAFHFYMPVRHHFFPGDVAWTEEGHRYAWRMMLRSKTGSGYFIVNEAGGEKQEKVWPRSIITSRQHRIMLTHPDMILQMAHYLRDTYSEQWESEVEVYARITCSLNGRPRATYIEPEINLSTERFRWFRSAGIISPHPDTQVQGQEVR